MTAPTELLKHVPKRFLDDDEPLVSSNFVNISKSLKLMVIITKSHLLFEVRNKEILGSVQLKSDKLSVSSVINETWSHLMETNDMDGSSINFQTYFSYDPGRKRRLHYLLQMHDTLVVVQRSSFDERSELVLKNRYEHVVDYKVMDEKSTGHPLVHIYNVDGSEIVTNFMEDKSTNSTPVSFIPDTESSEELLTKRCSILTHQLHLQRQLHQKLLQDIATKLKFGPAAAAQSSQSHSQLTECLVRYGDPWKRIHNDHLVIGIPVINSGSRQWTAVDISGVVVSKDLDRFQYNVHFFKVNDDSFMFDHFKELFEMEKTQLANVNESISNSEWVLNEERTLLPEQTGCVVFSMSLKNFQEKLLLILECFVTYKVTLDAKVNCLQVYGGSIVVDKEFLVDIESSSVFPQSPEQHHNFLYKNLLTIAVSSIISEWRITWHNLGDLKETLEEFLRNELNFCCLQMSQSEELNESQAMETDAIESEKSTFFYNNSGFLQHTLIRIKSPMHNVKVLTIYSRTKQQTVLIRDSILKDHKHECEIESVNTLSGSVHESLRSLLDEITICRRIDKAEPDDLPGLLKQKLSQESQTDSQYSNGTMKC